MRKHGGFYMEEIRFLQRFGIAEKVSRGLRVERETPGFRGKGGESWRDK